MKIMYFITKSEVGGAQTYALQALEYLKSRSNSVAIMSYPGGWLENMVKERCIDFYPNEYFSNSFNPWRLLKAIDVVKEAVNEFSPDIVECHSSYAGFVVRLAVGNRMPSVFVVHGWGFDSGVPFFRRIFIKLLEKIAALFCSKIVCVSNYDHALAIKNKISNENKLIVIRNGVITDDVPPKESTSSGSETILRVIFVGRLARPKDPLLLLRAYVSLEVELREKIQITIVGDGPGEKSVQKFIRKHKIDKNIRLKGCVKRAKLLVDLKTFDVFVLTTNHEGLSLALLEAMSSGLAVIASSVGGITEVLSGGFGVLVKRGDKAGVMKALREFSENREKIREYGEKAYLRVRESFALQETLMAKENLYSEILQTDSRNEKT